MIALRGVGAAWHILAFKDGQKLSRNPQALSCRPGYFAPAIVRSIRHSVFGSLLSEVGLGFDPMRQGSFRGEHGDGNLDLGSMICGSVMHSSLLMDADWPREVFRTWRTHE